jgi:hypothetical protein
MNLDFLVTVHLNLKSKKERKGERLSSSNLTNKSSVSNEFEIKFNCFCADDK